MILVRDSKLLRDGHLNVFSINGLINKIGGSAYRQFLSLKWKGCLHQVLLASFLWGPISTPFEQRLNGFALNQLFHPCWDRSKANAAAHSQMHSVRLGVFFPHEVAASFYNFKAGDLFYNMLTGTPEVAWLQEIPAFLAF